jgi:hypothetical protein
MRCSNEILTRHYETSCAAVDMVESKIAGVHANPPDLARLVFYFRPPLVLRAWSGVLRVHLNDLASKPDQPKAFSHGMQQVDCRTRGHGFPRPNKALFLYRETKWMSSNLSCNCQYLFALSHLRYRSSSRMIHQSDCTVSNPRLIGAALKRACPFTDVKLGRRCDLLTFNVAGSADDR